jgi:hypothetical protein
VCVCCCPRARVCHFLDQPLNNRCLSVSVPAGDEGSPGNRPAQDRGAEGVEARPRVPHAAAHGAAQEVKECVCLCVHFSMIERILCPLYCGALRSPASCALRRWQLGDGELADVHTADTIRAQELLDLYVDGGVGACCTLTPHVVSHAAPTPRRASVASSSHTPSSCRP